MEKHLKEKEEALKENERKLKERIEELETENIEFKLEMLAQHDSSKDSISTDQKKENMQKSSVCKGKPICIICQEKFSNKAQLKAHISKKHKCASPNSCPYCYKHFKTKKSLNNHIDSAHYDCKSIVNKEQCEHCQQKFGTTVELESHMEKCNHKASVTYGLKVQSKSTQSKGDHKAYEKRKQDTKLDKDDINKHQCQVCKSLFATKSILVKHVMLDHSDFERPEQKVIELPVSKCRRQPKQQDAKEKSVDESNVQSQSIKVQDKQYKCALCTKSFDTKIQRIAHIGDAHKELRRAKHASTKQSHPEMHCLHAIIAD